MTASEKTFFFLPPDVLTKKIKPKKAVDSIWVINNDYLPVLIIFFCDDVVPVFAQLANINIASKA